jgi:hypothetical protein
MQKVLQEQPFFALCIVEYFVKNGSLEDGWIEHMQFMQVFPTDHYVILPVGGEVRLKVCSLLDCREVALEHFSYHLSS